MMKINLPYPSNWTDFQELCAKLWREFMGDMQAHQNGRIGQRQNGVDFYGKYRFEKKYTGVQCKGKNGNYKSKLTIKEIDKECNKARNFTPILGLFVMATTSPRDEKIQKYCRELTQNKIYPFSVDTWFWDDIEDEVQCRQSLMEQFYPDNKSVNLLKETKISCISSPQKLYAFFTRPGLLGNLDKPKLEILIHLAYELASNAFEHGNATTFTISVNENKICYRDNGMKFDPLSLMNVQGNGGAETLRYANDFFELKYDYESENSLTIGIADKLFNPFNSEKYVITLKAEDVFGNSEANICAIKKLEAIPDGIHKLIIDITGNVKPAISMTYALFDNLLLLKPDIKTVKIYIPDDLYYKKSLIEKYKGQTTMEFIIKE